MLEIHSGIRPGRRSALLIATALVLTGAISLAWWQVHLARSLGPPIAVPGTPLLVRLPIHWKQDARKPTVFLLPTRGTSGQQVADFERRISFEYERTDGFRPLSTPPGLSAAQPARIGPYAGLQVRQQERRRWGLGQSILRVANLPNGDRVSVLYMPMSMLTTADLDLLDEICRAVQFNDPRLTAGWAEACRHAGVQISQERGWRASLPGVMEVPGLFVGGEVRGEPAWSLGVFRTWLAAGRNATDLLNDFAADYWLLHRPKVPDPGWERADGATVAVVHHPDPTRNRQPIAAAAVVARSPAEALLIFVYTSEPFLREADDATERLAREVQFLPAAGVPDIESAENAGREFAAKLAAAGPVPWWGELKARLKYAGSTLRGEEAVSVVREPLSRNPVRGYRGSTVVTVGQRDQVTRWEAARSGTYKFESHLYIRDGQTLEIVETRGTPDGPINRISTLNDLERSRSSFKPGLAFVSPPLASLAESWVARESKNALINEFSTVLADRTHTRLLRPLPEENGYARVLVQQDYWPFGEILGFDDNGEMQFLRSAASEYRRVSDRRL